MQRLPSALSALSRVVHVAGAPVPGICASAHDISPRLEVQLVLELKGREPSTEVVQILPCSRSRWFSLPFNEHLAHSPGQPSSSHPGRCRHHSTVQERRQQRWNGRRGTDKLLEDADVEHIMKASAGRKL